MGLRWGCAYHEVRRVGETTDRVLDEIPWVGKTNRVAQNQTDCQWHFDKLSAQNTTLLKHHGALWSKSHTAKTGRLRACTARAIAERDLNKVGSTSYLCSTFDGSAGMGTRDTLVLIFGGRMQQDAACSRRWSKNRLAPTYCRDGCHVLMGLLTPDIDGNFMIVRVTDFQAGKWRFS